MKQKALKLTGLSLAAAALFGTGCDIFGGGGGGDGGTTPTAVLAGKALIAISANAIMFDDAPGGNQLLYDYMVVGTDGSLNKLNRNDARDRQLVNVLSCPNGNAILRTTGVNQTYYFFDAQKNEIRFLAFTGAGSTVLRNEKREPVGIYSGGGAAHNGLLVAYCNGQYAVHNECTTATGCTMFNFMMWNTLVATNTDTDTVYSFPYPADLKGAFVVDNDNIIKRANVKPGNQLGIGAFSPTRGIFLELDNQNQIAALIIVDLTNGNVVRKELNAPVDVTPGSGTGPNIILVRDDGNTTYIAVTRTGLNDARIWYAKYDGTNVSNIATIDPDGNNAIQSQVIEINMDGKGRVYYIENNSPNTIRATDQGGNSSNANSAGFNTNFFNNTARILPLEDGVVIHDGQYRVFTPGGTLNAVAGGSDAEKAVQVCDTGTIHLSGEFTTVCADRTKGANEVAILPDASTNNWTLLNPDGNDLNNVFGDNGHMYLANELYLHSATAWYKCDVNAKQCSKLNNVTPFETGFSMLPQVLTNNTVGYISYVDLITDTLESYKWSYPGNQWITSWDGKKLAAIYASPTSICDEPGVGESNILVIEELGQNTTEANIFPETESSPIPDPFRCINAILHTW